jgi:hypothetical protein
MYENYYHHLKLAEERTQEGLRKAVLAQHARAANAVATHQGRTIMGFVAWLVSRVVGSSAIAPGGTRVVPEADRRLAQSRS